MESVTSFTFMIALAILIIEMFIAGIVGLMRKEIFIENLVIRVFLFPLGLFGRLAENFIHRGADEGKAAIASSLAAIAFGILLLVIFLPFYLDTYGLADYDSLRLVVSATFQIVILGLIVGIIYAAMQKNSSQKL